MYITYQDLKLHYDMYGSGKEVLVILPGWGETKNTFLPMIEVLSLDYTVYFIDYPGFGASPFPDRDLTMYDYCEAVITLFETLNIKNPNVIAHSFGGRIAILLSSKYAIYLRHLILIDSAGIKPRKTLRKLLRNKGYKLLQSLANILPKNLRKKVKHALFQHFASADYANLKENERKTFQNIVNLDLTPFLSYIQNDTLLLWGANDQDTPLKDGIKMQKKIRNSELIVFPRSGHFSYLENTYVILRIILKFFEE